jgi:hypothetical protein
MHSLRVVGALLLTPAVAQAVWGQTLQRLLPASSPRIEVFADGNLRHVIGEPGEGTNAAGSLGVRYVGPNYIATGMVNVAGTADTVTEAFGATMLAPSSGTGFNAGLLDIRRRHILPSLDKACPSSTALAVTPSNATLVSIYIPAPHPPDGQPRWTRPAPSSKR